MDENKFQIIDADSISVPVRKRKKKKTDPAIMAVRVQQSKEDDYWKQESRELFALARLNERKQRLKTGVYNEDENPYAHLVDPRHKYEIEMETVFHCDAAVDSLPRSEEVPVALVEDIVTVSAALVDEYNLASIDLGFDALYDLYCRVDANKDRISDLLDLENEVNVVLQDCYWDMVDLLVAVDHLIIDLGGW